MNLIKTSVQANTKRKDQKSYEDETVNLHVKRFNDSDSLQHKEENTIPTFVTVTGGRLSLNYLHVGNFYFDQSNL